MLYMSVLRYWCNSKASLRTVIEFGCLPKKNLSSVVVSFLQLYCSICLGVRTRDGIDLAREQSLEDGRVVLEIRDLVSSFSFVLEEGWFKARPAVDPNFLAL